MQIVVDADACPVKEIIVRLAKEIQMQVIMVIDTAHILNDGYSQVVTVDKGPDSADIALINLVRRGDIVVTSDYGVAAMGLAKGANSIDPNGRIYTDSNIEKLLFERHLGKKIRRAGGRTNNIKKRSKEDDLKFETTLATIIKAQSENEADFKDD